MDFKLTIQDRVQVYSDEPSVAGSKAAPAEEPAKPEPTSIARVKFGLYPRAVSEEERELTPDKRGVTVTRVEPGSFAEEVGMQEHDIIIAINRQPVSSVDDIRKIQSTLKPGDAVAFRVVRAAQAAGPRGRTTQSAITRFLTGTLPQD